MANDRFVYWKGGRKPSRKDIETILNDYSNQAFATEWKASDRYFLCRLPGSQRSPFHSMDAFMGNLDETIRPEGDSGRFIEVHVGSDKIDIVTRRADEFTDNIADGIARMFARYYRGELDMG